MTPLDLTAAPPRSCRVEIAGIPYLARAIDKLRAELPGGNLGDYINLKDGITSMSALFYRRMAVEHDALLAVVASATDDDEVGAWVRARVSDEQIAKWRVQVLGSRISDIPEPFQTSVRANHPASATLPADALLTDVFDAEDARAFATA